MNVYMSFGYNAKVIFTLDVHSFQTTEITITVFVQIVVTLFGNSSNNFKPFILKYFGCFGHGLKMCI